MDDIVKNLIAQWGAIGLLVVGAAYIIRRQWKQIDAMQAKYDAMQEKVLVAFVENTRTNGELASLIKSGR